jgi:hypothetical protein
MAKQIFMSPTQLEPCYCGIGFDPETWDFYIYVNGRPETKLPADQAEALRDTVLRTAPGKPR